MGTSGIPTEKKHRDDLDDKNSSSFREDSSGEDENEIMVQDESESDTDSEVSSDLSERRVAPMVKTEVDSSVAEAL